MRLLEWLQRVMGEAQTGGISKSGEKRLDPGCIMQMEPTKLTDGLDVERRVKRKLNYNS